MGKVIRCYQGCSEAERSAEEIEKDFLYSLVALSKKIYDNRTAHNHLSSFKNNHKCKSSADCLIIKPADSSDCQQNI
jgi:hypothetical protein